MDKNRNTEACRDESIPHLPMGRFFYLLHSNGFNVKPDDYIEMLKVTERFGTKDFDETAQWICPIIATSEMEQQRFYNVVEQYKKIESFDACADPTTIDKTIPRWFKITMATFLAVLFGVTLLLSMHRRPRPLEEPEKERTVEKGEPLQLNALLLLQEHPEDSLQIAFNWQFKDDGSVATGMRTSHVFKQPGDFLITRKFASEHLPLLKKSDSLRIHVCNDLPRININLPSEAVMVRQPVTITATVDADTGTVSYYQWTINDSIFTTTEPVVRDFIFTSEGDFPMDCKAVVGTADAPCTASDNQVIQVISNDLHYSARFTAARTGMYTGIPRLKWWVTLIFLLPAATGLLYSILKRRKKPPVAQEAKPVKPATNIGPFDIPFERNDTRLVQPERDLRKALVQMRYKSDEETMAINIKATINSIIRSGGSPQLVFTPLTTQQQYLVLIDRTNPKNMLTHFFDYLSRSMQDDGIPVVIFYYDKNFDCFNDHHPSGLSLQRLANSYSDATLIILGKAHELVYAVYPVIEEKYVQQLNRWQSKAIVTPVPLTDWGVKEKVLQNHLLIVPADVSALQKLIPALREKTKLSKRLLDITSGRQPSIRDTDCRNIGELKAFLGNDETLFQWLCAICIYPRLKWELLVEIGKTILDQYGEPEKLNYSNLLLLSRIAWMQQGVFPQATRLELLKELSNSNEILAREKLLHMLNYSTVVYGGSERFFEEEKSRQVLTNQFILHASNNMRYNNYAGSKAAFKKIWQSDAILDVPVKKYLDKQDGDNWQTPVSDGKNSVGLSTYFNLKEVTLNRRPPFKRIAIAAASLILIIIWLYIAYGGGAERFSPGLVLLQQKRDGLIPVEFKVVKNFRHCNDTSGNSFQQLEGYLEIGAKRYAMLYNQKTSVAGFKIPFQKLLSGSAQAMFSWGKNKSVNTTLDFTNKRLPDSVTIGCIDAGKIAKQNLYIRYNDTSGYRSLEALLTNTLFRFTISAEQVDFSDSSRIVYYETNQKPGADSIVRLIKRKMNITVREDFIEEIRTPAAVPILFINTSQLSKEQGGAEKTIDDPDYYQSLADQAFMKKDYRAAIAQYAKAIKLNPRNGLAWYQTGVCYEMLGNGYEQEAITAYNSAIAAKGDDPAYYYRRANVEYELKRYMQAINDFTKVISLNTENDSRYTPALYFRGKAKYFQSNITGACADFKKASAAGYAAGKKDYGLYCVVASTKAAADKPDSNYQDNPVQQQTQTAIPTLTTVQWQDMLLEVSKGTKTDKDFIPYLRGNDVGVTLNGATMTFTMMCKQLYSMKTVNKINVVLAYNDRNYIKGMTVTTGNTNLLIRPSKGPSKN